MWKKMMWGATLVLISMTCWAGPNDPIISMAWVGESVPGQNSATLQLNLTTVKPVNLVSVSSPLVETIEIHNLTVRNGAMKIQVVPVYSLPDHRTTPFGTRGLFLMMKGIKQPFKIGDKVPVSFTFAFADKQTKVITTEAEVRKMELSYKNYGPKGIYEDQR